MLDKNFEHDVFPQKKLIYSNNFYPKRNRDTDLDKHIRNDVKECQLTELFTLQKQMRVILRN